jgi:hypothetical protein
MSRQTPDLDSLIDGHVLGPERGRFARVHDVLVRAGPPPELPDTLARPSAVAVRRLTLLRLLGSAEPEIG